MSRWNSLRLKTVNDYVKPDRGAALRRGRQTEIEQICKEVIEKLQAKNMSDMGKVMAEIKNHKSSSQIDMANASSYVKLILSN